MSKAQARYITNSEETYNNASSIVVKIYYYEVSFIEDVFDATRIVGTFYTLNLTLNGNILNFEIIYNNLPITGFLNINYDGTIQSYHSEILLGYIPTPLSFSGFTPDYEFNLSFKLEDYKDFTSFKEARVDVLLQQEEAMKGAPMLRNINKFLTQTNNNTQIQIYYQTDNLKVNLGEMITKLTSDHSYPNGFPKKLIGYCNNLPTTNTNGIDTFYSFKPKLSKVLKLEGENLLDQTNNINKKYSSITIDQVDKNCIFFRNILAYSTLRYMFAGLSNNSVFSCKWLYANNYSKFLRNLENSEFSAAVPLFTEPQPGFYFSNYNQYYRSCEKHL